MARGRLITLGGIDSSGKSTQAELLVARLQREGYPVATMKFPTYGTPSAKDVEDYLNGRFGPPETVDPYRASGFYAENRRQECGPIREGLAQGRHYVLDRYQESNIGHQGGKFAGAEERKRFLLWLDDLEFVKNGIPRPDLVILLHMPAYVSFQFIERRDKGKDYMDSGTTADGHENLAHLRATERAYLDAAAQFHWRIVECTRAGLPREIIENPNIPPLDKVRTPDDIHQDIYRIVTSLL